MKVLFGLGNPGRQYANTRHNIGFKVIENFSEQEGIRLSRSLALGAVWGKTRTAHEEVRVVLPQSFMNLSGKVVLRCVKKWHVSLERILIVVDDLHLPLGQIRIRPHGSDGGQKGLRSIIEILGTTGFPRLRIGILPQREARLGRGSLGLEEPWEMFVLKPFPRREFPLVEKVIERATACCRLWIERGTDACMNRFNERESFQ